MFNIIYICIRIVSIAVAIAALLKDKIEEQKQRKKEMVLQEREHRNR